MARHGGPNSTAATRRSSPKEARVRKGSRYRIGDGGGEGPTVRFAQVERVTERESGR